MKSMPFLLNAKLLSGDHMPLLNRSIGFHFQKANLHASKSAIEAMSRIKQSLEKVNQDLRTTVYDLRNKFLQETRFRNQSEQEASSLQSELVAYRIELVCIFYFLLYFGRIYFLNLQTWISVI